MAAADPRSSSDSGPASRGGFSARESSKDRDGPGGGSGGGGESERDRATFECNICLDTATDAVISMCGHLFWYEGGLVFVVFLLLSGVRGLLHGRCGLLSAAGHAPSAAR